MRDTSLQMPAPFAAHMTIKASLMTRTPLLHRACNYSASSSSYLGFTPLKAAMGIQEKLMAWRFFVLDVP